jgi:GTP-binding protein LepA
MSRAAIRNFSIIAHIDHGKSTLADRMLEVTGTVEKRKMKEQVLDQMELERERGITIKMAPVRMIYKADVEYILNLIDTPGHIDFSYEVSRALKAVEGAVLLVDATQGVQAQTLTTLEMAKQLGLVIIPVVNKIDAPLARVPETKIEIARLLDIDESEIFATSGKTGEGVPELLAAIVQKIPPPSDALRTGGPSTTGFQSLVFDFSYSEHQGVIVFIRDFAGEVRRGDELRFAAADRRFRALEVGVFAPDPRPVDVLGPGEIGYIVTGIKEPGIATVGDTIVSATHPAPALGGYATPAPVVWASLYPESQDDFPALRQALLRLKLSDSSFSFEEEYSHALGRGFRAGFLGMLHLEIVTERLRREFDLELMVTTPSITYEVELVNHVREVIYTASQFPDHGAALAIYEPWVAARIICPEAYIGAVSQLLYEHEAETGAIENFGEGRVVVSAKLPLRELMRGFFDMLKSATSGYASLSYERNEMRPADVERLDILVAEEVVPAFSRVVAARRLQEEAEKAVEKLHDILPKQLFVTKVQARGLGRIISSKTLPALRKDVTAKLYGGDVTRKMKLLEKQKKGKKKMRARGSVNIPHEVFLKMVRGG